MEQLTNEAILESTFKNMDARYSQTHNHREVLLNKLMGVVEETNIDTQCDKPSHIEAKLQVFNTVSGLLNDMDKQSHNNVSAQLKRKAEETNESTSKDIVNMLSKIQFGQTNGSPISPADMEEADSKLDAAYETLCDPISEGEKREDHDDLK